MTTPAQESNEARNLTLYALGMVAKELEDRAAELSRPECEECFGPLDLVLLFNLWGGAMAGAVKQIEADQEEIDALRNLAALTETVSLS